MFQEKKIDHYTFNTRDIIGQGTYGSVYTGYNSINGTKVAIKVLSKECIDSDNYLANALIREIKIMSKLESENVVKLIEVCECPESYYLIQEFCKDGDLSRYMRVNGPMREAQAKEFLIQILLGFQDLIKNGVIHRDLKPANVLLHNGKLKLTDFGLSKCVSNMNILMKSHVGTPLFMSPQILQNEKYTSKCDIWSLGIIYYYLLYAKYPWQGKSVDVFLQAITKTQLSFPDSPKVSSESKNFILCCLQIQECMRLSWDQVFKHPLVKNLMSRPEKVGQIKFMMTDLRQFIVAKKIDAITLFNMISQKKQFNLKELHYFLMNIDRNVNEQEAQIILTHLDLDKNGFINFTELQTWFIQNQVIHFLFQLISEHSLPRNEVLPDQKLNLKKVSSISDGQQKLNMSMDSVIMGGQISNMDVVLNTAQLNELKNHQESLANTLFNTDYVNLLESTIVKANRIQPSLPGPGSKIVEQQKRLTINTI